ncbi:MAG: 6-carboxytetrahydropterin synthase [Peptococcaceae bacterium]|nr:6-carboxytetrahydropterin synthase [Peptococcaceae bacterium]
MFILKNEIQFDTAHYLSGYEGKCSNIHGHRYRLVVEFASDTLQESGQCRGMVADFSDVKKLLRSIADMSGMEFAEAGQSQETPLHVSPLQGGWHNRNTQCPVLKRMGHFSTAQRKWLQFGNVFSVNSC